MPHLRATVNAEMFADSTLARRFAQFPPIAGDDSFTYTLPRWIGWSLITVANAAAHILWDGDLPAGDTRIVRLRYFAIIANNRINIRLGADAVAVQESAQMTSGWAVRQQSCNLTGAGVQLAVDNTGLSAAAVDCYYFLAGDDS